MEHNRQQQHSELTPDKVSFFRGKLEEKEAILIESIDTRRKEALVDHSKEGMGNLSDYPQHIADVGTDEFNREFDLILMRRSQQELEEVRDALRRLDEGRYGICESSGEEISLKRLEALPEARLAVRIREQEDLESRSSSQL